MERRTGNESNHFQAEKAQTIDHGTGHSGSSGEKNGDRALSPSNEITSPRQGSTCLMEP